MLNGRTRNADPFVRHVPSAANQRPSTPPPPTDPLDELFDILISVYGAPHQRGMLHTEAAVTVRTAHHWFSKTHAPRVEPLFKMAAKRPAFKRALISLIERL